MKKLEEAIFRWESAVLIAAVLILTVFSYSAVLPMPAFWVWWYWLVLGGVGEGALVISTLAEKPPEVTCPKCGATNAADANFCIKCQASLKPGVIAKRPKPAPSPPVSKPAGKVPAPKPSSLPSTADLMNEVYRMIKPLGQGGMGTVHLVADTGAFDRPRVVKELLDYYDHANPEEAAEARRMFEREAQTLAQLDHPGIPDIIKYFTENKRNYLVMEYVEGKNLEKLVEEKGKIPILDGVRYGIQICEVLEYLAGRAKPVMHLDIKPANIIVHKNSRRAVLVDFGTAKVQRDAAKSKKREALYGTVGYAPPEQYRGTAEPRSDVYALAATLYHVITGDDPTEHPNQYPQLSSLSKELRTTLKKALEPDVKKRATATEFRKHLEKFLRAKQTRMLP